MSIRSLLVRRILEELTSLAVEVSDTKNVNITAVCVAGAAQSCLAGGHSRCGWNSHGTSEEAEEGNE
jgi:hypothetical protein